MDFRGITCTLFICLSGASVFLLCAILLGRDNNVIVQDLNICRLCSVFSRVRFCLFLFKLYVKAF